MQTQRQASDRQTCFSRTIPQDPLLKCLMYKYINKCMPSQSAQNIIPTCIWGHRPKSLESPGLRMDAMLQQMPWVASGHLFQNVLTDRESNHIRMNTI